MNDLFNAEEIVNECYSPSDYLDKLILGDYKK